MDGGAARRSDAGQNLQRGTRARRASESALKSSTAELERMTKKAQSQRSVDPSQADHVRSQVYLHLSILASSLKPISDGVRIKLPRKPEEVEQVGLDVRPILANIVGLFGFEQNIVHFVDDDARTNTQQIKQIVELQESLNIAIANYLDVVEGIDRGGARRSNVRREFLDAFRQLQGKLDAVVGELRAWDIRGLSRRSGYRSCPAASCPRNVFFGLRCSSCMPRRTSTAGCVGCQRAYSLVAYGLPPPSNEANPSWVMISSALPRSAVNLAPCTRQDHGGDSWGKPVSSYLELDFKHGSRSALPRTATAVIVTCP
jgi:hypothetical protein